MTTTPVSIDDARTITRDDTARCIADPARAAFMARLTEHEDVLTELNTQPTGALMERFRMTRRAVVAAFDHASLHVSSPSHPDDHQSFGAEPCTVAHERPHGDRSSLGGA